MEEMRSPKRPSNSLPVSHSDMVAAGVCVEGLFTGTGECLYCQVDAKQQRKKLLEGPDGTGWMTLGATVKHLDGQWCFLALSGRQEGYASRAARGQAWARRWQCHCHSDCSGFVMDFLLACYTHAIVSGMASSGKWEFGKQSQPDPKSPTVPPIQSLTALVILLSACCRALCSVKHSALEWAQLGRERYTSEVCGLPRAENTV